MLRSPCGANGIARDACAHRSAAPVRRAARPAADPGTPPAASTDGAASGPAAGPPSGTASAGRADVDRPSVRRRCGADRPTDRSADLQRHVVPGCPVAVPRVHRRLLRIAQVLVRRPGGRGDRSIPPTNATSASGRRVPDDEQLLVVRGHPPDPLVEQHLGAGLVELGPEPLVLLRVELQVVRVRSPQQRPDLDPGPRQIGQDRPDRSDRREATSRPGRHASR